MKTVLQNILLVAYAIVAIAVTVLLLSYNEYKCSEVGGSTFYIVSDRSLEPTYQKGDLLIIENATDREIFVGDNILLYKVLNSEQYELVNGKLLDKVQRGSHISYSVEEFGDFDSSYLIGKENNTVVVHYLGTILGFLESQWGYLFCIVIPTLLLFLQEVFELFMELKYGNVNEKEAKEN